MRICILAFLATLAWFGEARSQAVYWNFGIGSVEAGYSLARSEPIGYKIHFVGIGPSAASEKLAACIRDATIAIGEATQSPLDRDIKDITATIRYLSNERTSITKETIAAGIRSEMDKTAQLVAKSELDFRRRVTANCPREQGLNEVRLGIVNRICMKSAPESCIPRRPNDHRTTRYAKLYEWMRAAGVQAPVNEIVQLVASDGKAAPIKPDLRDRTYLDAWAPEEMQRQFEVGRQILRSQGLKYNYYALKAIEIDRKVAIQLLDGIDHPIFIIDALTDRGGVPLIASNETARTRLKECVLYRGKNSLSDIASCSGYSVSTEIVSSCLSGGKCVVDLSTTTSRLALALPATFPASNVDYKYDLPRIIGGGTFSQFESAARQCASTSPTQAAMGVCMLASQTQGPNRTAVDCISVRGFKGSSNCVAGLLPATNEGRIARCLLEAKDSRSRLLCAAAANSPEAARALECYRLGGSATQIASCVAASNLPPEIQQALSCSSSGADYKAVGGCLVARAVPGELGRLGGCAATSGGNYVGIAGCMAGGGLTPEQQILLQCATQSADLTSFAVCTGGQLLMREWGKCQDSGFGDGECFGESNDIRKLSRNLGLGDLDGNTVVGQFLSEGLDNTKSYVASAEKLLKDIGRELENAGEVVTSVVGAVADVNAHAEAVKSCLEKPLECGPPGPPDTGVIPKPQGPFEWPPKPKPPWELPGLSFSTTLGEKVDGNAAQAPLPANPCDTGKSGVPKFISGVMNPNIQGIINLNKHNQVIDVTEALRTGYVATRPNYLQIDQHPRKNTGLDMIRGEEECDKLKPSPMPTYNTPELYFPGYERPVDYRALRDAVIVGGRDAPSGVGGYARGALLPPVR